VICCGLSGLVGILCCLCEYLALCCPTTIEDRSDVESIESIDTVLKIGVDSGTEKELNLTGIREITSSATSIASSSSIT
jgi:hypothetical protein